MRQISTLVQRHQPSRLLQVEQRGVKMKKPLKIRLMISSQNVATWRKVTMVRGAGFEPATPAV
jgi:hypothetical protein